MKRTVAQLRSFVVVTFWLAVHALAAAFCLLTGLASRAAWAQDAAAPPINPLDAEMLALINELIAAAKAGHVWPIVGVGVRIATSLVRKGALKLLPGKVGEFINGPVVSMVIPFVLAVPGNIAAKAVMGAPITLANIILESLAAGAEAIVIYVAQKKRGESRAAGAAAAAAVVTKADAIKVNET